ncbi:hypothetical protein RDI58_007182 [Solanum bulbocastanum]|uniref:Helicase ATP-binding domain-containing protein n=1 Tax=Solanum bulbocastanum TaxID=147425 RepID=A0AAN8TW05_SOLBU
MVSKFMMILLFFFNNITKTLQLIKPLQSLAENWGIALFVVDEVHCVSKWGGVFRPDYRFYSFIFLINQTNTIIWNWFLQLKLKEPLCFCCF